MLKQINNNLRNLEIRKQTRLKKLAELQAEINDIDKEIKDYTALKKQYENLEKKLISKKKPKTPKKQEVQNNE